MAGLVRGALKTDAQAIINILNPIIETGRYTSLDTTFSLQEEEAFIEAFPARGIFHVATHPESGEVVDFQDLETFAAYTHAFDHVGIMGTFVHPDCRRQGVSSALFAASFAAARDKGYEKIFTFVQGDNDVALSTYLSQGFQVIGTAKKQAKVQGNYIDENLIEEFL